ncbi:MAG: hypothetical protein ABDH25_00345 [Dictyoglomaceae bacterium]
MKKLGTVAFLSTYPPQECGIATFTIEENDKEYKFNNKVVFKIKEYNPSDYILSAQYINKSNIDMVNIQHEFGIFGGKMKSI